MAFDIALRTLGASTLLLTATVLLLWAPRSAVARGLLPFALGVAGFLGVNTAFDAAELPAAIWPFASFASRMAAVALWWFCLVLFDAPPRAALAGGVVGTWLLLVVIDKAYLAPPPTFVHVSDLQIGLGTTLILHAGWHVLRDLREDLVEHRRRARPAFALALLAFLALDFATDVVQGYGWRPPSFLLLQNAFMAGLALSLALWMLRATPALAVAGRPARPPTAREDSDTAILARIETLMQTARPWLDPALTFSRFAAQVGLPEPALRRAINHRLGHGHFRNFLNTYRVEEAQRRLRDSATTGDKIVTIALDSGFSSLASFNRAFRQVAGCAPSEYRAHGS